MSGSRAAPALQTGSTGPMGAKTIRYNTSTAMTSPRPARMWSGFALSRGFVVAALVGLLAAQSATAQAPRRPQPLQIATRAYLEGRYDEIEQLTDKLDAR